VFETEKRIDSLKSSDVQNAAKNYLDVDKALIITVKPEKTNSNRP
jgi:predicted Zn-dependent peptidase